MPGYRRGRLRARRRLFGNRLFGRGRIYRRRKRFSNIRRMVQRDGLITKLRYTPQVQTSVGGVIQSYFGVRNPSSALDWTGVSALYDFYRIHAVRFQWIPTTPNDVVATRVFHPMYILIDQDDIDNTNFTSADVYLQYSNVRIMNLYQPWSIMFKVSKIMSANKYNSGTTGAINGLSTGHFDINTRPDIGIVTWYSSGLTAAAEYGTFIITLYTSFRSRR